MEGNLEILIEFPSNKFFKNAAFGLLMIHDISTFLYLRNRGCLKTSCCTKIA